MKVLFLSTSTGGGHLKAAKALDEYINMIDKSSETVVIDTLEYVSHILSKIVVKTYINMLKVAPKAYGKIYNKADDDSCFVGRGLNYLGRSVNSLFSFKIDKLVKKFKPDVVVCTHPFSVQVVKKLNIPTIALLTDYTMHPMWIKECIDAYVIPHELLINDAVNKGVEKTKIYPFGIPVENKFLKKTNRKDVLEEFGLKDKMTVLIMGGSLGLGKIYDVFLYLIKSNKDFQIIVITGENKKLKKKLENQFEDLHKDVIILDYTDEVNKLMDISDFVITKPGGLTVAESLIKRLPICIISPIPGQEEKNSDFLLNCGVALSLEKNADIDNFLNQVIGNEIKVESIEKIAKTLAKPNACYDIYNLMCELVRENKLKKEDRLKQECILESLN